MYNHIYEYTNISILAMAVSRYGAVASPGETALLAGDFLFLRVYDYCRLRSNYRHRALHLVAGI